MKRTLSTITFSLLILILLKGQTLTTEQKVEDFNYLYKTLEKNYPYFGILEREYGYNWLENKFKYYEQICKTQNNKEFYKTIRKTLRDLHNGHTGLMPTLYRDYFIKTYSDIIIRNKEYKPWINELEKGNNYWSELLNIEPFNQDDQSKQHYDSSLLSLKIIDTNNIAVISIRSFDHFRINKDTSRIISYINSIKNYKNLIIDIQDNEGGDSKYWSEHIVPYLIEDTIFNKTYMARKKGELVNRFFEKFDFVNEDFNSVGKKPNLPKEIVKNDYNICSTIDTICPKSSNDFKGKIFLLVNRNVYSSAEAFAVFCKMTKWATVVGEITAGDGIGTDPVLVCLPNSKIILRFPGEMGLNPDGSSNEERQTTPDIKIDGKTESERLINLIKLIDPKFEIE